MSQELTKIAPAPAALCMSEQEVAEFQEAFAANVSGGNVSEFDLPRIKVMSGAPLWLIPKLEGEDTAPRIEGVIIASRDTRVYYRSKEAGNVPPDCSSSDCVTGHGTPGGECASCPLAVWDSADGESSAQACKQVRQLFMLRGESTLPDIVSLPPTSVKPARQFFLKLLKDRIPHYGAIVAIELEKATSAAGKAYGKARFNFVRRLSQEEQARALQLGAMIDALLGKPAAK
jgi:hypothetical protein